jgi:hypothetical protein
MMLIFLLAFVSVLVCSSTFGSSHQLFIILHSSLVGTNLPLHLISSLIIDQLCALISFV